MHKYYLALLFLVTQFLVTQLTFAQTYQSGIFKIESMRFETGSVKVRFNPAPTACQGGNKYRMHAEIPLTQGGSKELVALMLAAYTANMTLSYLWFSNEGSPCSSTHILNLDMAELSNK